MKKKTIICSVVVLVLFMFFYSASFGECPKGKSEIQLITPSGIQKSICIPDEALPGLENAADHSDGTIIPSSCPCWNADDIAYYESAGRLAYCTYVSPLLQCFTSDEAVLLEASKGEYYCENFLTSEFFKIDVDEWNACSGLVEKYLR